MFINEPCHPCSRVVWNAKVLKEEDEHRGHHRRGECKCEVIFDQEERERRLRPRPNKGKGKAVEYGTDGSWSADDERTKTETGFSEGLEEARLAAYRYVGYYGQPTTPALGPPEQSYAVASGSQTNFSSQQKGISSREFNPAQHGGMKWYHEVDLPALPTAPAKAKKSSEIVQPHLSRSGSAPAEAFVNKDTVDVGDGRGAQQPMVVSSDMSQLESK